MTVEFFLREEDVKLALIDNTTVAPNLLWQARKVRVIDPKVARDVGLRQIISYKPYATLPSPILRGREGYIIYTEREGYDWIRNCGLEDVTFLFETTKT